MNGQFGARFPHQQIARDVRVIKKTNGLVIGKLESSVSFFFAEVADFQSPQGHDRRPGGTFTARRGASAHYGGPRHGTNPDHMVSFSPCLTSKRCFGATFRE